MKDYFKKQTSTWEWFASERSLNQSNEAFKTDILKSSYRISPDDNPKIFELLGQVKEKLGVVMPVTIYQSQYVEMNNASIVILENEAHLVLSGYIEKLLTENEMIALLGHEISHLLLYTFEGGDYEIANRIINAIANEDSELYYNETARLYQLYTELFCDLGALKASGDISHVICTLVKVNTGIDKVSAENYLEQAKEILDRIELGSEGVTHPELYIRARSLELFRDHQDEHFNKIAIIVNGKIDIKQLNIFTKKELHDTTQMLVDLMLKAKWTQSDHCIVMYKNYFTDYNRKSHVLIDDVFKTRITNSKENTKDYFCYVMLDFALCDSDIKEPFLGHILDLSEQLGLEENIKTILKKELRMTDKAFKEMSRKSATTLNEILESENEKTY